MNVVKRYKLSFIRKISNKNVMYNMINTVNIVACYI